MGPVSAGVSVPLRWLPHQLISWAQCCELAADWVQISARRAARPRHNNIIDSTLNQESLTFAICTADGNTRCRYLQGLTTAKEIVLFCDNLERVEL